jgi:hypothetical protein
VKKDKAKTRLSKATNPALVKKRANSKESPFEKGGVRGIICYRRLAGLQPSSFFCLI